MNLHLQCRRFAFPFITPSLTGAPSHHPIIHHACNGAHDDGALFISCLLFALLLQLRDHLAYWKRE
jgi:hypothetical protein